MAIPRSTGVALNMPFVASDPIPPSTNAPFLQPHQKWKWVIDQVISALAEQKRPTPPLISLGHTFESPEWWLYPPDDA